jgi:hypothetical protein
MSDKYMVMSGIKAALILVAMLAMITTILKVIQYYA